MFLKYFCWTLFVPLIGMCKDICGWFVVRINLITNTILAWILNSWIFNFDSEMFSLIHNTMSFPTMKLVTSLASNIIHQITKSKCFNYNCYLFFYQVVQLFLLTPWTLQPCTKKILVEEEEISQVRLLTWYPVCIGIQKVGWIPNQYLVQSKVTLIPSLCQYLQPSLLEET